MTYIISNKCGECSGNYWRPKPGQDWAYFRCITCNKKEKKPFEAGDVKSE